MLSVLKIGGSVLRDAASYAATAEFLRGRLAEQTGERLVVIVSAQYGATDELLSEAEAIASEPDQHALDLLWCTGELRSVARLTLRAALGIFEPRRDVLPAALTGPLLQ